MKANLAGEALELLGKPKYALALTNLYAGATGRIIKEVRHSCAARITSACRILVQINSGNRFRWSEGVSKLIEDGNWLLGRTNEMAECLIAVKITDHDNLRHITDAKGRVLPRAAKSEALSQSVRFVIEMDSYLKNVVGMQSTDGINSSVCLYAATWAKNELVEAMTELKMAGLELHPIVTKRIEDLIEVTGLLLGDKKLVDNDTFKQKISTAAHLFIENEKVGSDEFNGIVESIAKILVRNFDKACEKVAALAKQ